MNHQTLSILTKQRLKKKIKLNKYNVWTFTGTTYITNGLQKKKKNYDRKEVIRWSSQRPVDMGV